MVNTRHIQFHIFPAIAAVLVAAAFALSCFTAPHSYASDTNVTTFIESQLDIIQNTYGDNMSNPDGADSAMIAFCLIDAWAMNYTSNAKTGYLIATSSGGDGSFSGTYYYTQGGNTYTGSGGITITSSYIRFMNTSYLYNYNDMGAYAAMCSVPGGVGGGISEEMSRYYPIYSGPMTSNSSAPVGVAFRHSAPTVSGVISQVKSAVSQGNSAMTTTLTTTTTTVTTTTTATLATFPYQTNPPFELPSEWLGDYSETVPVPSVPPVTTVDVSGYDEILTDAENNFLSAIGFWFLAMKDFLSMNPTITYIAVFTIAIVLIILLLYNRGDDN